MYLTRAAIDATLDLIAGFASGTEAVIDHIVPDELRDADGRAYAEAIMSFSAGQGEPWLTCLGPQDMASLLAEHGLEAVEHVGQRDAVDARLWNRSDPLRPASLAMLARARVRR